MSIEFTSPVPDYKIAQGEVDNGVFEAIRLEIVARGYLPNFVAMANNAAYEAAKVAIRASGKQIIEVFGVGSAISKGMENINAITITRETPRASENGQGRKPEYVWNVATQRYDKYLSSDSKFTIPYGIYYMTNTSQYADLIEDILRKVFGIRKLITSYKENGSQGNTFWFIYTGEADMSTFTDIERRLNFEARNIDLLGAEAQGSVAALEEITLEQLPQSVPAIDKQQAINQATDNNSEFIPPLFEDEIEINGTSN